MADHSTHGADADRAGAPARDRDPTENVLKLVQAAERRQDDLREADSRHFRELLDMIIAHFAELRSAEAARLDAIRAVDNAAVTRAAEVQSATAQALATVVATTSETQRAQATANASAQTATLAAALDPIRAELRELRQSRDLAAGGRASTREGEGDRRSQVGMIVAILSLAATVLIAAVAFAVK